MFFRKKEIPDIDALLERLGYLQSFLQKLTADSQIRKSVEDEIEKINSILRVFR